MPNTARSRPSGNGGSSGVPSTKWRDGTGMRSARPGNASAADGTLSLRPNSAMVTTLRHSLLSRRRFPWHAASGARDADRELGREASPGRHQPQVGAAAHERVRRRGHGLEADERRVRRAEYLRRGVSAYELDRDAPSAARHRERLADGRCQEGVVEGAAGQRRRIDAYGLPRARGKLALVEHETLANRQLDHPLLPRHAGEVGIWMEPGA